MVLHLLSCTQDTCPLLSLRNKVSTVTKRAKAEYYFNLFKKAKTSATYQRLLKKASGTAKTNNQAAN